MNLLIVTLTDI